MREHNGRIELPSQQQIQALQAQQQMAAQQQHAMQQALALENARSVALVAATLYGKPEARTPQVAVELACELLFRGMSTLSLPRMQAKEAEIKAALAPA